MIYDRFHGAVAQLGERRVRNAKVVGSTPIGSTNFPVLAFHNNESLSLAGVLADLHRVLRHEKAWVEVIKSITTACAILRTCALY